MEQLQEQHRPPVTPPIPIGDVEPVRIALEGGGIGRVSFSGGAATPDDIDALIDVLQVQQRQLARKAAKSETSGD
jgi:hypothetical protein